MSKLLGIISLVFACISVYYWYSVMLPAGQGIVPGTAPVELKRERISVGGRGTFDVDVADTEPARERGLSGRAALAPSEGMLFIFDTPDKHGFWMREMLFSIDIIWFDERGKVIWIQEDVSPDTYPHSFKPPLPDKYVLEVNAGIAGQRGISVGDQLEIVGREK